MPVTANASVESREAPPPAGPAAAAAAAAAAQPRETGSLQGPPRMPNPPQSIAAKALHSFWWALRPYLPHEGVTPGAVAEAGNGRTVWVAGPARRGGTPRRAATAAPGAAKADGTDVAAVVHYNVATRAMVVALTGSVELVQAALGSPKGVSPAWLAAAKPGAKVVAEMSQELDELLGATSDPPAPATLLGAISAALGGVQPLSLTCTGYGAGGGLAALAAARLALRFPGADAACFAFGAPNVGNQAFAEAFSLLVGQSFRVEHAGDPLTAEPSAATWTFPASFDLPVGVKAAPGSNPWASHTLISHFEALLASVDPRELPYNAPGVYLMVQPSRVRSDAADALQAGRRDKPWPIDDWFVPGLNQSNAPLRSPFDAEVELEGGRRWPLSALFDAASPLWREAARALGAELGGVGALQGVAEAGDWRPSPASQPAASANDRFLPPVAAEAAGAPVLGSAAAAAGAAVAVNRASADAAPLPYLRVAPAGDLAGQARAWDMLAGYRLPLPLLLADAAYRQSPTAQQHAPPVLYPAAEGLEDPFHAAISGLVKTGQVLGYRLIDDTFFSGYRDGKWDTAAAANTTNTQAYVVLLADGTAVFAFRGTAQMLPDWATNFDMARRSLEGDARGDRDRGDVHQGFMRGFCAVAYRGDGTDWPSDQATPEGALFARHLAGVLRELMEAHPATRDSPLVQQGLGPARVICVGHSLGGALATLCASWAAEQYPLAPVSLYTFGQPRVGDAEFVAHVEAVTTACVRLVHRLDVVPLVPLHAQGFSHYYPAGYLAASLLERLSMVLPWPSQLRLRLAADRRWLSLAPSLARGVGDHMLDRYTTSLQRALNALGLKPDV